jgi:hypothetical protein
MPMMLRMDQSSSLASGRLAVIRMPTPAWALSIRMS